MKASAEIIYLSANLRNYPRVPPSPHDVIAAMETVHRGSAKRIAGRTRQKADAKLRRVAMAVSRAFGTSYTRIAYAFGKRDHTTVLHHVDKYLSVQAGGGEDAKEEAELFKQVWPVAIRISHMRFNRGMEYAKRSGGAA